MSTNSWNPPLNTLKTLAEYARTPGAVFQSRMKPAYAPPSTDPDYESDPEDYHVDSPIYSPAWHPQKLVSRKRKGEPSLTLAKRAKTTPDTTVPQGLQIAKSHRLLGRDENGTVANEFVAPWSLVESVSQWSVEDVFGKRTKKRWSTRTIHEYFKLFPTTCDTLLSRCYFPDYVPNPQQYIDFCGTIQGLQKVRKPEKDGKWLERDTQWYSFVDTDGFSTVYRGGSIDYGLPKQVTPQQFKMDANFNAILPTVQPLLEQIHRDFGEQPNHCVITRYNRTYDGIRRHTDKTKDLVRGSSIFVFTFGATKTFEVAHQRRMAKQSDNPLHYQSYRKTGSRRAKTVARWKPVSGSLIRMTWDMNQIFEHGVPVKAKPTSRAFKEERESTSQYDTPAPRYSITFRTKCTWYQPQENKTFVDSQWQLSSLQTGGAVRVVLQ